VFAQVESVTLTDLLPNLLALACRWQCLPASRPVRLPARARCAA